MRYIVRKATPSDKNHVLTLLDEFRDVACSILWIDVEPFTSARNQWGDIYETMITNKHHCIMIAEENDSIIWVVTLTMIPQLRKWKYYGEIEELYVQESHWWQWVAKQLLDEVVEWIRSEYLWPVDLRLESDSRLDRAHWFYKKYWFEEYASAFKITVI